MLMASEQRLDRGTARDGETELLIFMCGGDVFVGVCFHPSSCPDHDPRPDLQLLSDSTKAADLVERVDDDPSDGGGQGITQLLGALVIAVQPDSAQIDSGALHDSQLTAGAHIDAEPFLGDPTRNRRTEEGFGGVIDVPSFKGFGKGAGPGT